MKRFIAILALFVCSNSFAVSFDCAKFNTGVYKIICESPELSKLDDELSERYNRAVKIYGNDSEFKKSVRETLAIRDACKDEACLIDWYKAAIEAYKSLDDVEKPREAPQASNWRTYFGFLNGVSDNRKWLATVAISDAGYYWMYFSPVDSNLGRCTGRGVISQSNSINFNGVLVRMVKACNEGSVVLAPATFDGDQYVLNQFITKNEVILKNAQGNVFAVFSAVGFRAGLNEIRQYRGGI